MCGRLLFEKIQYVASMNRGVVDAEEQMLRAGSKLSHESFFTACRVKGR